MLSPCALPVQELQTKLDEVEVQRAALAAQLAESEAARGAMPARLTQFESLLAEASGGGATAATETSAAARSVEQSARISELEGRVQCLMGQVNSCACPLSCSPPFACPRVLWRCKASLPSASLFAQRAARPNRPPVPGPVLYLCMPDT